MPDAKADEEKKNFLRSKTSIETQADARITLHESVLQSHFEAQKRLAELRNKYTKFPDIYKEFEDELKFLAKSIITVKQKLDDARNDKEKLIRENKI